MSDENDGKIIEHSLRLDAMERLLEHHTKEIAALSKNQNRLLIALIIVTMLGSDAAAPIVLKLIGA